MEWCGQNVDGASYEEVKRVLTSTEGESNVELLVKECRYGCGQRICPNLGWGSN